MLSARFLHLRRLNGVSHGLAVRVLDVWNDRLSTVSKCLRSVILRRYLSLAHCRIATLSSWRLGDLMVEGIPAPFAKHAELTQLIKVA